MSKPGSVRCPSSKMKKGSELLAIRKSDGMMAILPQPLQIDEDFINKANGHAAPAETRFRFTNKCIESGCKQWNGKGCGMADFIVQYLDKVPFPEKIPDCSIRSNCRWFLQQGAAACKMCPYVAMEL